jgi:regulator of protease activity HflC (stomatin/prohibitin superfamily)
MDQLAEKLSFRVQELNVKVETKTLDNVFVIAVVSVQYQILQEKVYDAVYALTNPVRQITAHVYDVLRSQLPTLELDAVFEAKDELALAIKNALAETMSGYGYQILQALITDIEPDQRVKVCIIYGERLSPAIVSSFCGATRRPPALPRSCNALTNSLSFLYFVLLFHYANITKGRVE